MIGLNLQFCKWSLMEWSLLFEISFLLIIFVYIFTIQLIIIINNQSIVNLWYCPADIFVIFFLKTKCKQLEFKNVILLIYIFLFLPLKQHQFTNLYFKYFGSEFFFFLFFFLTTVWPMGLFSETVMFKLEK